MIFKLPTASAKDLTNDLAAVLAGAVLPIPDIWFGYPHGGARANFNQVHFRALNTFITDLY
jgi:hypothetical protein